MKRGNDWIFVRALMVLATLGLLAAGCDDSTTKENNGSDFKDAVDFSGDMALDSNTLLVVEPEGGSVTFNYNGSTRFTVQYVAPDATPIPDANVSFEIVSSTNDCHQSANPCLRLSSFGAPTNSDGMATVELTSKSEDTTSVVRAYIEGLDGVETSIEVRVRSKDSYDLAVEFVYDGVRQINGVTPRLFSNATNDLTCDGIFTPPLTDPNDLPTADRQVPDVAYNPANGTIDKAIFTSLPNNKVYAAVGYALTDQGYVTLYGCSHEVISSEGGGGTIVVELQEVPIELVGTYNVTSYFNLLSGLPRRASEEESMQAGDYVDMLINLFQNPGDQIWQWLKQLNSFLDFLPDELLSLEPIVVELINSALEEYLPGWAQKTLAVGNDLSEMLTNLQLGGELQIVAEPDFTTGELGDGQLHRYFSVTFPWTMPCVDDPNASCDPVTQNLRTLTGDPTLVIEGSWSGSLVIDPAAGDLLRVNSHGLTVPYGLIALAVVENFALPELFDNPNINSIEAMVSIILIDLLVDYYNGTADGMANPIVLDETDPCSSGSEALAALIVGADAGFGGDVISNIAEAACNEALDFIRDLKLDLLGSLVVQTDNNLVLSETIGCPITDDDGNLQYDTLGGPAPNDRCDWQIVFRWSDSSDPVDLTGNWFGARGGL